MGVRRKGKKKVNTAKKGPNKVRAHTRSPRGPDKGKPRVVVPNYRRRKPRR